MRVYVNEARENWILDVMKKSWDEDNADISTNDPNEADVIWLLSDFTWHHVPTEILRKKKVLSSVHHVVREKFDNNSMREFKARDSITSAYVVPNFRTKEFVSSLTSKPVNVIPYWCNQRIWQPTEHPRSLRKRYEIPDRCYAVGSFVRDTEGASIANGTFLPKLEKGPDLLCDFLETLHKQRSDLHVVLAGWRRQYVTKRLKNAQIPYSYFELPSQEVVNDLYQTLDLYPVTSRYEGGPQSFLECGALGVQMVSTPVGMAEVVLPTCAINVDVLKAVPTVPDVESLKLPNGYKPFLDLLHSLCEV